MPQETESNVIHISKKKLLWGVVGIIIVLVLAFLVLRGFSRSMIGGMSAGESISSDIPSIGMGGGYSGMNKGRGSTTSMPPIYDDYYGGGTPSISDTREFIKTNYSATLRTRNVSDAVEESEDAIRQVEGRIDNRQNSEKFGYIRFVVPKDRFYEFKDMIEEIVPGKLYAENISSQNLLGQKQNIEENFETTQTTLAQLEQQKKNLDKTHASVVSTYQKELSALATQLINIRQQIDAATSTNERTQLRTQESLLIANQTRTTEALYEENRGYGLESKTLATRIAGAKSNVNSVVDQDIAFGENIETVNGYINVQWISVWNILRAFSPIRPGWIVFILILIAIPLLRKMRILPKIELV